MDNKKVVSAVLASAIITSSSADVLAYKNFKDMPNNWARAGIENAVRHNLIQGYKDEVKPFDSMTRAEMATIMNRLLGLSETGDISKYKDVSKGRWYYNEMAKSVKAGIFVGSGDELHPEDPITREEAFLVVSRVLDISKAEKSSKKSFTDYNKVSPWTLNAINGLVDFGYLQGDHMSRINPKGNITRAEFAALIKNISNEFVQSPSSIEDKNVSGNLIVSSSGVKLKNVKVAGDLILTEGVGKSEVDLTNVKVSGRILVRAGSAVKLNSSQANQVRVISGVNELSIEADKDSSIKSLITSSKLSVKGDGKLDKVFFKKGSNGSKIDTKGTEVVVEDDIVVFDKDGKEIKLTSILNDGKDKTDKDKADKDKKTSYEILSIANVLDSKDTFVVDFGDKVKEEDLKGRVMTLEYLGKSDRSKYRLLDADFLRLENGIASFKLIDKGAELEDRAEYRVITKWIGNKKEVKFTVENRINRREYDKLYDLIDDIYKLDKDKYERREYEALMDKAKDIDKKSREINSVIELQRYVEELTKAKNTLVPVGAADLKNRLNLRMDLLRNDKLKLPKELEEMPETTAKDIEKKLEEVNKLLVRNDKVMNRIEKAQNLAKDRKYDRDRWVERALEKSKDLRDTTIEERENIADDLESALADFDLADEKSLVERDLAKLGKYADSKFEIKSGNLKEVKAALADAETSVKKYSGKDKDKLKGIENIKKVKDKITAFEKAGSVVDKAEKELEEAKKAYEAALKAGGKLSNIESLKVTGKNPTKADYEKATKAIKEAIKKADSEKELEDSKAKEKEALDKILKSIESAKDIDTLKSIKIEGLTGDNLKRAEEAKATKLKELEELKQDEDQAAKEKEELDRILVEINSATEIGALNDINLKGLTGDNLNKAKAAKDIKLKLLEKELGAVEDEAKQEVERLKNVLSQIESSKTLEDIEKISLEGLTVDNKNIAEEALNDKKIEIEKEAAEKEAAEKEAAEKEAAEKEAAEKEAAEKEAAEKEAAEKEAAEKEAAEKEAVEKEAAEKEAAEKEAAEKEAAEKEAAEKEAAEKEAAEKEAAEKEAAEKEAAEKEAAEKEAVEALFKKESLETELELAEDVDEETIEATKALVEALDNEDLKKELNIKILKAEVLEALKDLEAEETMENTAKFISEKLSELEEIENLSDEDQAFVEKYKKLAEESIKTEEVEADDSSLETQAEEAVMALFENK